MFILWSVSLYFKPSFYAAALAQLTPVLPLLDRLREAGATIMPEVWHYITAAQITPGVVVPPEEAPSPAHAQSSRWGDHG